MRDLVGKLTFVIFIAVFSSGCLTIRPGAVKSGKNLYETFFVGVDGTQYFVKPFDFVNTSHKEDLQMDITFRYKNVVKDSATINMSIIGKEMTKSLTNLSVKSGDFTVNCPRVKLLFNEKKGDSFHSRFSTKCALSDLDNLFRNDSWLISSLNDKGVAGNYKPSKKAKKIINKLNEQVFVVFR